MKLRAAFVVLAFLLAQGPSTHSETQAMVIRGIVTSTTGIPIPGVEVYGSKTCKSCLKLKIEKTKTDKSGSFILRDPGELVRFRHPHFRPVTRLVEQTNEEIHLQLEESDATDWILALCTEQKETGKRVGSFFTFLIPPGVKVRTSGELEGQTYAVRYDKKNEWLRIWSGAPYTVDRDAEHWKFLESNSFGERWIRWNADSPLGIDAQGTTKKGRAWRSAAFLGERAEYRDVSDEAADYFDKIIASACPAPPGSSQ